MPVGSYPGTFFGLGYAAHPLSGTHLASASGTLFREGTKEGTEGLKRITGEKKRGQKKTIVSSLYFY